MFTVLSNTRNSNLYLAAALAIAMVVLLTFVVAPAISAPRPVAAPMARLSEAGSDYYLRHPELRISAALVTYIAGDFYLRHPEWASNVQNAAIPVTGNSDTSDYFQRHQELNAPAEIDGTGLYQNYPGAWVSRAAGVATPLAESLERPGMACESPVDCR
jgi:hypothetical protein